MRRALTSTVPVVASVGEPSDFDAFSVPVIDSSDRMPPLCFARCAIPTRAAAMAIADREAAELDAAVASAAADDDAEQLPFVVEAREQVRELRESLQAMRWPRLRKSAALGDDAVRNGDDDADDDDDDDDDDDSANADEAERKKTAERQAAEAAAITVCNAVPTNDEPAFSDDEYDDVIVPKAAKDASSGDATPDEGTSTSAPPESAKSAKNVSALGSKYAWFYQSSDQRRFFLHPLCMRALLNAYGSPEHLPLKIESKLVEVSSNWLLLMFWFLIFFFFFFFVNSNTSFFWSFKRSVKCGIWMRVSESANRR